ncbi:MAG TPA: oligosaccharide flippase family protein, partial [Candidatus Doudnabacteria bacterium]|nr:oligosaccharide flippase family protein [Candidatus Doudnabacteria bacterium]
MATPSKNILWLSVSRVFSLGLLFLAYTQLFRYLGPEQSGQFQFVLSYVTLFGVVIDFGIQQYIIKKISEDRSKAKQYFHNFLAVEVVLAVVVYGAMVGVAYWNGYEPVVFKAILVAGFGVALHGLIYPFLAVITAFYDLKKAALLNFISSVINVGIIFLTIWVGGSIVMLTSQQVIYAAFALVMYYWYVQPHIGKPEVLRGIATLNFGLLKSILRAALPFALLVGFSTIYNRIDIVIITQM